MNKDGEKAKDIDLDATEWESERKGEYPKKLWFGLTDYGPPPLNWDTLLTAALTGGAVALGIGLSQLAGWQ